SLTSLLEAVPSFRGDMVVPERPSATELPHVDKDDLLSSSKRLIHLSLGGLGAHDQQADVVVLHAGVAVEHALKAYLCSIDPSLVADGRDLPSLLHAAGRADLAKKPLPMIKTIGAVDAFRRVSQILDGNQLGTNENEFRLIADARNGVAHIGIHDTARLEDLLSTAIKILDAMLVALGEDPTDYWGDYTVLHDKILDGKRQADKIRIEALKTRARRTLIERFGADDTEERRAAIAGAQMHSMVAGQAKALRPCPACANNGWVGGDLDTDFSEPDPQVVISPRHFLCSVCGFAVDGPFIGYFDELYPDIPMGPTATFIYEGGSVHEALWMNLVDNVDFDRRRREEEENALRGLM
ncbi:hypothetical protein, partial [Streptomyces sp. NPDC048489]|uniref:hypothetical protein n=1 Tax=Streptomyces sp. NPDC048489 TaxID=3154504 RepID=UPI00342A2C94